MTYVDWFDHRRLHDRLSCMWSHVLTRERAGNAPSLPSTSFERIPAHRPRGTIPVNVDMSQRAARGKFVSSAVASATLPVKASSGVHRRQRPVPSFAAAVAVALVAVGTSACSDPAQPRS